PQRAANTRTKCRYAVMDQATQGVVFKNTDRAVLIFALPYLALPIIAMLDPVVDAVWAIAQRRIHIVAIRIDNRSQQIIAGNIAVRERGSIDVASYLIVARTRLAS